MFYMCNFIFEHCSQSRTCKEYLYIQYVDRTSVCMVDSNLFVVVFLHLRDSTPDDIMYCTVELCVE